MIELRRFPSCGQSQLMEILNPGIFMEVGNMFLGQISCRYYRTGTNYGNTALINSLTINAIIAVYLFGIIHVICNKCNINI